MSSKAQSLDTAGSGCDLRSSSSSVPSQLEALPACSLVKKTNSMHALGLSKPTIGRHRRSLSDSLAESARGIGVLGNFDAQTGAEVDGNGIAVELTPEEVIAGRWEDTGNGAGNGYRDAGNGDKDVDDGRDDVGNGDEDARSLGVVEGGIDEAFEGQLQATGNSEKCAAASRHNSLISEGVKSSSSRESRPSSPFEGFDEALIEMI